MPCVHDKLYYKLMELNKHHHLEDIKNSLEEGEELTEDNVLEKVKDLEPLEEPFDSVEPSYIFEDHLLQGTKQ